MIKIENLKKSYFERDVLNIPSLHIKKSEVVVVIGANGSGKSTLLKILAGTLKQTDGKFTINGKALYLPQQSVPFSKSVYENVVFSMQDKKNADERCKDVLLSLGLWSLKDKNAKTLSGGECQRLALARILVNDCDVLFLDEPSSAADIESIELIENAILNYRIKTDCSILMTSHLPSQAKKLADRIIILDSGEIAEQGSVEQLLNNPTNEWVKKFISQWKIS